MSRNLKNGFGVLQHSPFDAYVAAANAVEQQFGARSGPSLSDEDNPYGRDLDAFKLDVATQLLEALYSEDLVALFMLARDPQEALEGRDQEGQLAWNEAAGWLLVAWIEANRPHEDEVFRFALTARNRMPFLFALANRPEGGPIDEGSLQRLESLIPTVGGADAWWLAALLLRRGGPQAVQKVRPLADRYPDWGLPR